jgi:hypothetical protein
MGIWLLYYSAVIMSKDNQVCFCAAGSVPVYEDLADRRARRNYNSYIFNMHTLCGIMHQRLSLLLIFVPLHQTPGTIANFFALYLPPSSFLYLRSFFLAQSAI